MGIVSRSQGGGSGGGALLFSSVLGADTASIDTGANGIAQTQNVLEVFVLCRTDEAAIFSTCNITVNNDTGANYDRVFVQGANVTAAAANSLAQANWALACSGNTQDAGVFSALYLTIPQYAATVAQKTGWATIESVGVAAARTAVLTFGLNYRLTTAISRLKIAPGAGTVFRAGSALLIYGR